jgi:hypothetical protein
MEPKAEQKTFSFGEGKCAKMSPPREAINSETKAINLTFTLEEALMLNLAIDECIRRVNTYKKTTTEGKKAGVNLTIYLNDNGRITVNERKIT